MLMKKFLLTIILSFLISSVVLARSTGCKEGNCENGFGKWVYTDKTTYEGEWVGTKKMVKVLRLGQMDIFTKANLRIVNGVELVFWLFPMVQPMKVNGLKGLWMAKELLLGLMDQWNLEFGKMVNYKIKCQKKVT